MLVFVTTIVGGWLAATQPAPEPKKAEKKVVEVVVEIGNGKFVEDPKKPIPTAVVTMDAKGQFRSGVNPFGQIDPGLLVAKELKTQDFVRLRIDLDNPTDTSGVLVLRLVDRITRSVPDGKRVELKFTYKTDAEKK
ncbi:MAG: hypothetical protein C0467_26630 [Planctomycetaceae bacterium]|nr:hypothetical protein [Planctomycetaceae bacterium]